MIMRVRMGMIVGVRAFMRVTVSRIVVAQHLDTGGGNAGAQDTGDAQLVAGPEGAERILERLERQAGIEQGAEHHVARRTREAVEIQCPRHQSRPISFKEAY
jgi:hypothetical protein